jgi:hypothetical protein
MSVYVMPATYPIIGTNDDRMGSVNKSPLIAFQVEFGKEPETQSGFATSYVPYSPDVKGERCDACKIIANRFDVAFRLADAAIQGSAPFEKKLPYWYFSVG